MSRLARRAASIVGGDTIDHPELVAPKTSFSGRISPHRRFTFGELSLDEVKAVKNAHGVTVNDVVVTLFAGAVRRWLIAHDELPEEPLVAQVPVSERTGEQAATYGNRILLMRAPLFTDEPDPVRRLERTHEALREMKERRRALPTQLLQDANHFIPPLSSPVPPSSRSGSPRRAPVGRPGTSSSRTSPGRSSRSTARARGSSRSTPCP